METRQAQTWPKQAPDRLAIWLMGEIRVQRGSAPVLLPASKRTRALLGFLVATAKPQPRQTLCDLLWDGPDDPRAALRWSLTKLRALVDDAGLRRLKADRERISFSREETLTDVGRLDELLGGHPERAGLAEIEEAATLLQGEFLDGLDLPSCYRFHHWCLAERERWGALRRRVLLRALHMLEGDPDRALPYARAMVGADPLLEEGHAWLVSLLSALGRRKDAQDHYDYAREMLRRETAAPLTGALKPPPAAPRNAPAAEPAPSLAAALPPAAVGARPAQRAIRPLVGRLEEQRVVSGVLDAFARGVKTRALLFLGESGIGKSRLLDFTAREAAKRNLRVIAARCFEAEAVRPYGCWADVLGVLIDESPEAAARHSELALFRTGKTDTKGDEGSRTRMFTAVTDFLTALSREVPLILILDDLQWIDEGSSSLLHYVVRIAADSGRLLFAGAARTGEIDDNPSFKRVASALVRGGLVTRLDLHPLGSLEVAQFLDPQADAGRISAALKQSGGNPLFLTELAIAERLGKSAQGRGLEALIGERISRLDEPERDLIIFASATARDFKPELLGAAMELPAMQLIERIERLERRGLLKPGQEGRFDFAHDLIRQITYQSLSQPRRRLIHRQIARTLAGAAVNDRTLAGELAYHAGAAGDHLLAVQACAAAGQHCLNMFANAAAIDAAGRGMGHLERLQPGAEQAHWRVQLLNVKVFASAGPGIRVQPGLMTELLQAAETAELMDLRDDAVLGWHLIAWWSQRSNDTAGAQRAILRAEEISRQMADALRAHQLANTARCLLDVECNVEEARQFLREAAGLAAAFNQHFVELDWGHGLIARWDGDLAASRACLRRALALGRLREDRWREMECLACLAKIAIESGRPADVGAICDDIDAAAARIGGGPSPVSRTLRALALLLAKDETAGQQFRLELGLLRSFDDKTHLSYVLNEAAAWWLEQERLEEMRMPPQPRRWKRHKL